MSFYQECLTLGQYLSLSEKAALYEFLLNSKSNQYEIDARKLLENRFLKSTIANGVIEYTISGKELSYKCHEKGSSESPTTIRQLLLGSVRYWNTKRIKRFFAQAEVDVLSNYPLPGIEQNPNSSFTFNSIPFYDLNHYSNNRGRIRGYVKRIEKRDREILLKLKTL